METKRKEYRITATLEGDKSNYWTVYADTLQGARTLMKQQHNASYWGSRMRTTEIHRYLANGIYVAIEIYGPTHSPLL